MKWKPKRDLPLLLAALLVIWASGTPGRWGWRPCFPVWSRTKSKCI